MVPSHNFVVRMPEPLATKFKNIFYMSIITLYLLNANIIFKNSLPIA